MKVDILAIAAHPDDVELSCCGTLLRHINQGKTVGLIDLTRGELGTRGNAEIREEEAKNAAELMGAEFRKNLDMPDGFFRHSKENLLKLIQVVRQHQPDIVLANAPEDRHPDHAKAAKLISDACYFAGLIKIESKAEDSGEQQNRWRPKAVYHFIQDYHLQPDFVVDITGFWERKLECIRAFRSQIYVPEAEEFEEELDSPISGKDFIDFLESKARTFGRPAGFELAEGFIAGRTVGVRDLFDLH
jgi:bacillithiol biosynthesis deacetylase BshB1